jgi:predicted nucleic-acid-binding protein
MAEAALKIFEEAKGGKLSLLIIPITVAEVVWVLESYYEYSKDKIAETMTQFLSCEGLEVESLDLLLEALNLYCEKNLDFADAILAITALKKGIPNIYSFDQHFNRINGIIRMEPGKK